MATVTMGLRRRVPPNNSTIQSPSTTTNKRSRSENNNQSNGNLNSINGRDYPPTKKSRGGPMSVKTNNNINTVQSTPKGRGSAKSRTKNSMITQTTSTTISNTTNNNNLTVQSDISSTYNVLGSNPWSVAGNIPDGTQTTYTTMSCVPPGSQGSLCSSNLGMPPTIPYMATSMATFVGNATNLGKNSSVSYLDISNMTSGSLNNSSGKSTGNINNGYGTTNCSNNNNINTNNNNINNHNKNIPVSEVKTTLPLPFSGAVPTPGVTYTSAKTTQSMATTTEAKITSSSKFLNDTMFNTYQPWVIKTYGDLAKTKTITIKKYGRILRTLRGEEVNSAENSKFRFWVKSKGFHIGQPEGYDAKPADRIIGRHAVTSPGLDPPLYVPTQLPHSKALSAIEGATQPGRVYKKVAIVENFFDIIHAVHVDLEGRPGKHAGQKRTYRTITETYAFLPREAVTRFLLGCTECQRRPRTPSPTNHSQSQSVASVPTPPIPSPSQVMTPRIATASLSPTPATALSAGPILSSLRPREASNPPESKSLFNYRHPRHQRATVPISVVNKVEREIERKDTEKDKEVKKVNEPKYNPLSITNLLKKETPTTFTTTTTIQDNNISDSRKTPESDRASSKSSASSKRRRMLPEGRTPSPPLTTPLARPWSPGLNPKETPVDYSLSITTTYLKHQQRIAREEQEKAAAALALEEESRRYSLPPPLPSGQLAQSLSLPLPMPITDNEMERERFSPAAGLIDTNLNLLATIQQLHCQVMLALTERLRPSVLPLPLILPTTADVFPSLFISSNMSMPTAIAHHQS